MSSRNRPIPNAAGAVTSPDASRGRIRPSGSGADLDVRQLRAFVAVVQEGTVSRAASALGLSQSTVSEALAALDRALGTPTVHRKRGGQRLTLTAAGAALLPHARRTLEELEAAHLSVASVTHAAKARIEIVANESVSTYLLPSALGDLRKTWPRTRFVVSIETCATIREHVAGGLCDLGLLLEGARGDVSPRSRAPSAERHEVRASLPLIIFAGSTHPLVRSGRTRPIARDALSEFPVFVADATGDFYDLLLEYFVADGVNGQRLEPVGTIDAVRRSVADDPSALGVLPLYTLANDLHVGHINALTVRPAPPSLRLVALLPLTGKRHPAVSELLDRLRLPAHSEGS